MVTATRRAAALPRYEVVKTGRKLGATRARAIRDESIFRYEIADNFPAFPN